MSESHDHPSIYHPDIGEYIEIRNELAFRAASVVWDAIAAKYALPTKLPALPTKSDAREENLAKAVISDEIQKVKKLKDIKKPGNAVKSKLDNTKNPWTDEEMFVIQDLPDWRDAVVVFAKAFPDTKRSKNAVEQQWKKIAAGIVKKRQKPTETVSGSHPDTPVTTDTDPASDHPSFTRGQKVKHNGHLGSPYYRLTGTVERTPPGDEVMVRFENGTVWIPKKDLVVTEG